MKPWLQAGKYAAALMSQIPRRNGWTIAGHAGDRSPDRTQRLLNRAVWDTVGAASQVRRFVVTGNCTGLREFFEQHGQAYVLRVACTFMLDLAAESRLTCAQAVKQLGRDTRRWEVRSAGAGSKGARWYAWMWIATASPRHYLLGASSPAQR